MYCQNCGEKNPPDAIYCEACGTKLEQQDDVQNDDRLTDQPQPPHPAPEKSGTKVIIILSVVIVLIVAVIVFAVVKDGFSSDKKNQKAATEEQVSSDEPDDSTEMTTEEVTEASTEADEELPAITAGQTDYDEILNLSDYSTFYAEGYSFGYPTNLYEKVEKQGDTYWFDQGKTDFASFSKEKRNDNMSIAKELKSRYETVKNGLNSKDLNEILYKSENGIFVIAGENINDKSQQLYYLERIENGYIYRMTIGFKFNSDKEENYKNNYYVDTMYRMCSFGRGSYKPRTYQQFKNNDMGTKK